MTTTMTIQAQLPWAQRGCKEMKAFGIAAEEHVFRRDADMSDITHSGMCLETKARHEIAH